MLNVGLVTGSVTPSARAAPRASVVLPAPRSPELSTTSPGRSPPASSAPSASVSCGPAVSTVRVAGEGGGSGPAHIAHAQAQADTGGDQAGTQERDRPHVITGVRQAGGPCGRG